MVPSFSSGPIANCAFTRRAQSQIHGSRIATAQSRTSKFTTRTHEPALHSRTVRSLLRSHHASRMIHLFPSLALVHTNHTPDQPRITAVRRGCNGSIPHEGSGRGGVQSNKRGCARFIFSYSTFIFSFFSPPFFFGCAVWGLCVFGFGSDRGPIVCCYKRVGRGLRGFGLG